MPEQLPGLWLMRNGELAVVESVHFGVFIGWIRSGKRFIPMLWDYSGENGVAPVASFDLVKLIL